MNIDIKFLKKSLKDNNIPNNMDVQISYIDSNGEKQTRPVSSIITYTLGKRVFILSVDNEEK